MKKSIVILSMIFLLIVGCSNNSDELTKLKEENKALIAENTKLKEAGTVVSHTYKDFLTMEVKVLDKLNNVTKLHPNILLVTLLDEDHNTPMAIHVPNNAKFNQFEIGETRTIEIYAIHVIEDDHVRYEYFFAD